MIAIVLQKNLKPDRSGHTHRAELGSKPQVCAPAKPTAKSCFANTMDPQGREPNHTVQLASVREGWGRVLKAEHPILAPPRPPPQAEATPSIHGNMLLPTNPSLPTSLITAALHRPSKEQEGLTLWSV